MDDLFAIPAIAISAFEAQTGLHVCIHDLGGCLRGILPPARMLHASPACVPVKARFIEHCMRCDVEFTRKDMARTPAGRVQVCHAGYVEWVVPEYAGERIEWVLFAGQRRPGEKLDCAVRAPRPVNPVKPIKLVHPVNPVKPVEDDEALHLLELARQLAARLSQWRRQFRESAAYAPGESPAPAASRASAIQRFIQARHAAPVRLADMAAFLHLSESRTAHAVREACGKPFIALLTQARLDTAAELLRYTELPVGEIALRSGFGDLSHFHALFRREKKISPHQFRKRQRRHAMLRV